MSRLLLFLLLYLQALEASALVRVRPLMGITDSGSFVFYNCTENALEIKGICATDSVRWRNTSPALHDPVDLRTIRSLFRLSGVLPNARHHRYAYDLQREAADHPPAVHQGCALPRYTSPGEHMQCRDSGLSVAPKVSLTVFPNPAGSVVNIRSSISQRVRLEVRDLFGRQLVPSRDVDLSEDQDQQISTGDLPAGLLCINMIDAEGNRRLFRIIKR